MKRSILMYSVIMSGRFAVDANIVEITYSSNTAPKLKEFRGVECLILNRLGLPIARAFESFAPQAKNIHMLRYLMCRSNKAPIFDLTCTVVFRVLVEQKYLYCFVLPEAQVPGQSAMYTKFPILVMRMNTTTPSFNEELSMSCGCRYLANTLMPNTTTRISMILDADRNKLTEIKQLMFGINVDDNTFIEKGLKELHIYDLD